MSGGLLAVASIKGSPGVTTAALAFAAAWPSDRSGGPPVVLLEADPAGGNVGGWYRLSEHPGLLSWAAAARTGPAPLADHTQTLPGGLAVVPAPIGPLQARGALDVLAQTGGLLAAAGSGLVVADCGRLDPGSPSLFVTASAGVLVVLVRPDEYELARLASRAGELTGEGKRNVVVVLAGPSSWPVGQVEEALGLPVVGALPHDPHGAVTVAGGKARGGPGRTVLARAAAEVACMLAGRLARARPVRTGLPLPLAGSTPAGPLSMSAAGAAVVWPTERGPARPAAPAATPPDGRVRPHWLPAEQERDAALPGSGGWVPAIEPGPSILASLFPVDTADPAWLSGSEGER
ncbi:hypothetical protein [Frankia sp. CiP3]|uniref:MinD/ParA family ATP-binding protein n=1 Tax=Frankia sp. CiP3 TaxID=2880971 RepID=UPI001EF74DDB|nr:hypothetical protein [Frankia sp. CiP3]